MFCIQCGNKLEDTDSFCGMCGAPRADEKQYRVSDAPSQPVDEENGAQVPDDAPIPREAAPVAPEGPANSEIPHEPVAAPSGQDAEEPSSESNRKAVYIAAAILAAAIAVAAAILLGGPDVNDSDESSNSASADAVSISASSAQAVDSTSSSRQVEGEPPAEAKAPGEEEASADRIQANGFSFKLPEYWKGKVICVKTDNGVAIYPDATLGTVEGYTLATLSLVSADEPENSGDYISHIAGRVRGEGVRVDVSSKNWPAFYGGDWYRHPNYAGSSQEREMVTALIDLSSGGAYSSSDVRSAAESAANDADAYAQFQGIDVDFLNETLIPTVKLDGADDASGGGASSASSSANDYESIAEAFALRMFTSAENTGDGAMRWIGCDSALELVEPGSKAEACGFWEDTKSHGYLRIAKEATVTKTSDSRHFQIQVTYESAIDATGENRRANIATIELWLTESGLVEDIEAVQLG